MQRDTHLIGSRGEHRCCRQPHASLRFVLTRAIRCLWLALGTEIVKWQLEPPRQSGILRGQAGPLPGVGCRLLRCQVSPLNFPHHLYPLFIEACCLSRG